MRAESHVVWSTKKEIDLGDPAQKKGYIQDVLTNGLASDVAKLDWEEIERILPHLKLPERVCKLWGFYFEHAKRQKNYHPPLQIALLHDMASL